MGIGRQKLILSGVHVFFPSQEWTVVCGLNNYYCYHLHFLSAGIRERFNVESLKYVETYVLSESTLTFAPTKLSKKILIKIVDFIH